MPNNHISSTEFTSLCQSQINLLTESLGAVWSVIYLAEEVIEDKEAQLFPLAIYPQNEEGSLLELPSVKLSEVWQQLKSHSSSQLLPASFTTEEERGKSDRQNNSAERKQLILPLVHQETFIGLLVTGREDREWQAAELKQVEEIARTLAIARFLELQYHWSQQELAIQENLRSIERDRLDNLLHQLRNPLTALKTFSKLLLKRVLPEDRNHKVAKSLLEQSDRFQQLLEQFEAESAANSDLDLPTPLLEVRDNTDRPSNFLLPSLNGELASIDLTQILDPLLDTARAIAAERNILLQEDIIHSIPKIKGDLSALREVFNNLIDNALKYTPEGGKVRLDFKTKKLDGVEMLGIAIADTGFGIPQADLECIFDRHYRGIQAESDIPGTGLGLAIAKELVLKMQGEIELISPNNLSSDSPGTTFIVWLLAVSG